MNIDSILFPFIGLAFTMILFIIGITYLVYRIKKKANYH